MINARYANTADLGFGRDMHCLRQDAAHVACYVSNYLPLDLNDDPVFDSPDEEDANAAALQDSSQLVATVAMEYSPIEESGDDPVVKFYVYNADGERVGAADLDGLGERPVPQLCMMCHVSRDFYRDVFAKSCRSCHIANTLKASADTVPDQTGYPFRFRNQFDFVDRLGSIQALVCSARVMPHSLVTYNNFWATGQNELLGEFGETFGDDSNGWISGLCGNPESAINFNVGNGVNTLALGSSAFVRSIAIDTSFRDTIEPIFQNKCGWCHYPNNPDRPGASYGGILQKGSIYSAISPYIESGAFLDLIDGVDPHMPKNCVGKYCITNSEINAIEDWIDSGASNGLTLP